MSSSILPGRFDNGDFECWLCEFDMCCDTNDWKVAGERGDNILKLPAFLRAKAASHFYAIPTERRKKYKDAVAELKKSLCPAAQRETFYVLFESCALRTGEDPGVYKWELENLLAKADPELSDDAKTALIHRQFMKGLPNILKLKLLEHNPTPNLDEMLSFVQQYRAVEGFAAPIIASEYPSASSTTTPTSDNNSQLSPLLTMVASIAEKQQSFENHLTKAETSKHDSRGSGRQPNTGSCFNCGEYGNFAQNCRQRRQPSTQQSGHHPPTCFTCGQLGHVARNCTSPLNYYGMVQPLVEVATIPL